MIVRIRGKLASRSEHSIELENSGLFYEILVPPAILARLDISEGEEIELILYEYIHMGPSRGMPCRIGFLNQVERDFFLDFIQVSGIGPRAAVKALNQPISQIAAAIGSGDHKFLKSLPGIGMQKSKEIVAKLQGRIGKYGLIQDRADGEAVQTEESVPDWQTGALDVLLQLQYKRQEAVEMVKRALKRRPEINSTEELLNEIYKQRITS
ncbi:MAG: Holliday junction branch migration protein RuvA [Candidatus Omnitrophota bacterium]